MNRIKLSRCKWLVLTSALGALAVAGPSPFNPPAAGPQVPAFAFLGLVYGWVVGLAAWRYVLQPVQRPDVPLRRKQRIVQATLVVALVAIPAGILAHRLLTMH